MTDANRETNRNNENDSVYKMYHVLEELTESNTDFFKNDASSLGKSLYSTCLSIINNLNDIRPLVEHFRNACPAYDFDEQTPGNGYRSYVMMVDSFVVYGVKVSRHISGNRNSYFFRKGTALKELEACEQGLSSLCQMLTHLQVLMEWSEVGCLYPREPHAPEELLSRANNLNQYCFYGRCLGFQFCESMQTILKGLGILMASFSELYYSNGGMIGRATSSLWNSSKYLVNPELRAKRIVNISQYASVNFCKQFWFLGEMETMKRLPNFVTPSVLMNRIIIIPPEPITVQRTDATPLDVPIPKSHTGPSPLSVRLMSSVKRLGMVGEANTKNLAPPAEGFLFHCHGGGFVAQSSRSHETYLCQWAKSIDVPILSVDYSLAPEAPFPRALEDTFYAYCWALNHLSILGTTGKRIVAAGDSAGGNLVLGLTVKCIMEGVRPPDGLFLAYVPVIVSIIPSPARLLCLMDPLLPLGFLTGCLRAYACTPEAYEAAVKGFEEKLRHQSQSNKRSSTNSTSNSPRPQLQQKGTSDALEMGVDSLQELNANHANTGTVGQNGSSLNDDMINGNASVVTNIYGEGEGEEENFVAGFVNKYATDAIYNNNNGGGNMKTLIENDAKIRKLLLDNDLEKPVTNDDDDGVSLKRSNSTLTNIATIIGNTFTSFTGGTVNSEPPQTTTVTVSGLDNSATDGSLDNTFQDDSGSGGGTALLDDFEEVMLPCPLEMLKFEVPDTPLLSPYYASDDILSQFPPTSFMTLHMDPCLDDCVEFSKKLKRLNNRVNIDILEGLPHGFLNFSLLSKEAYEGSKKCTERLKALLDIDGQSAPPVIGTEATEDNNTVQSNGRNKCSNSASTVNNL